LPERAPPVIKYTFLIILLLRYDSRHRTTVS
jgi:hypothetical protein